MGSFIEINDTLQLTSEQGFPRELDADKHLAGQLDVSEFIGREYDFYNKPALRIYHSPPTRCFFAHNIAGKWVYWGHVYILNLSLDCTGRTTGGRFKIIQLYSPEEMRIAHEILDRRDEVRYFRK